MVSTLRALVVEDDENVRMMTARCLAAQAIVCDMAANGAVAARKLKENPYDIVITDLRMPNGHGHALCKFLLERPNRPLIVVIAGAAEPRLIRDLEARGVDAVYHKPLNFAQFGAEMRKRLDDRRARVVAEQPAADSSASAAPTVPGLIEVDAVPAVAILMHSTKRGQQLATALQVEPMNVFVGDTADALWACIKDNRVDVLVLENAQYGFLSGIEILDRIQAKAHPPSAIVVGPSEFTIEQINALRIRKVFPLDAPASDIVQAVRSTLFDAERSSVLSPHARTLVKSFGALPQSPAVLLKLTKHLQSDCENIPMDALSRDIMADPATTAELLRLANASSLGLRRQVTDIGQALSLFGPSRAISLLLAAGVRNAERNMFRRLPANLRTWYQLRTILIASISAVFADRHFELSGDTAFVLGLFQDMGILVLANSDVNRYSRLIEDARSTTGAVRLHAIEQQCFNVNHAEVSAALVDQWNLPDSLVAPIRQHHDASVQASDREDMVAFVRPMRIGEAFADLWHNRHPARKDALLQLLAECPNGTYSDYKDSLSEAVRRMGEVAQMFMLPQPHEATAVDICRDILSTCEKS